MKDNRRSKLAIGVVLMVSFLAVLVAIFLPLVDGGNTLNFLDNLYNSISKGSAYYVPGVLRQVDEHGSQTVTLTLDLKKAELGERVAALLEHTGATVSIAGATVTAQGELEQILRACAEDADAAYHGRGDEVEARRGMPAKIALHGWWSALGAMERELTRQELFGAARLVHTVKTKAVECAYNYYGIDASQITERWGIVLVSLVFYVIYTVWYGYAILYLFEGFGLRLSH